MPDNQPSPFAVTNADAQSWKFQQSYIERLMDHSALTSAHPDDTLILAGPPRYINLNAANLFQKMLPIGMVQQMQVTQQKPTTPMQAVGTGRGFYTSGKAQGSASVARLFVNGRNLLRALYTNAVTSGIDVTLFDDPAAYKPNAQFFANLDSELFLIPFGMAVLFRDKIHNEIGAFYLDLCMINTWAIAIGAGQNMILENVNLLFDRLNAISTNGVGSSTSANYNPADPANTPLYQSIFQKTGVVANPPGGADNGDTVPVGDLG
jgi:hypothetical protein